MFILDTHVLLWLVAAQYELTEKVKKILCDNSGNLYISSISAFEIAIKHNKNKIQLPMPPDEWFQTALALHGIDELHINSEILIKSASLPFLHNDPADRIIIATAMVHNAKIISKDGLLQRYHDITVVWE
ncbi:type II toxin-antitoxin system VapC family toxin [candidate division KSB1 bacterium]|nr:type II toxin-antitoxin system VapC family toxin [candidate division KSB1 bacterium]